MTLTIAICTAGRDSLIHAVRSLKNQSQPADKLIIVDQSGQGKARAAVAEAEYPFPVLVIDQNAKGLSTARNEVLLHLDTDWLFFTDDDCVASLDLVQQFHKVTEHYPEAAFLAGACLRPLGYNPVTHDVPGVTPINQGEINFDSAMTVEPFMGACLAFRRDLLEKVGAFDSFLGAGNEWAAGEEIDYVFRAIMKGFKGRTTMRVLVYHEYGVRKRPEDDTENGRIGNAVVFWKMQKIGDELGIAMAKRIYPVSKRKLLKARLKPGSDPIEIRMFEKCRALEARLNQEFDVKNDVLVKKPEA